MPTGRQCIGTRLFISAKRIVSICTVLRAHGICTTAVGSAVHVDGVRSGTTNAQTGCGIAAAARRIVARSARFTVECNGTQPNVRFSGYKWPMRRVGIFEDEPQAQQAATMLREQGFQADVISATSESYGEGIKRFFRGETHGFNGTILVTSEDAGEEQFDNAVVKQYGRVITDTA